MWLKVVADAGVTIGTELEAGPETAPELGVVAPGFEEAEGELGSTAPPLAEGVLVPVCNEVDCELVFAPFPAPLPQASVSATRQIATNAPTFPFLNLSPAIKSAG
jgi:hypothetical protein